MAVNDTVVDLRPCARCISAKGNTETIPVNPAMQAQKYRTGNDPHISFFKIILSQSINKCLNMNFRWHIHPCQFGGKLT